PFDDLRQRDEQRRTGRFLFLTMAMLVTLAIVGAVAWEAVRERRQAEARLAQILIAQADSLLPAGRITEAKRHYIEAYNILSNLKESILPADLGLLTCFEHSPPPVNCFDTHQGELTSVAISSNGKIVLSGALD